MERDSFVFYRSFYEAIKELPPKDKVAIMDAICEYSLNGVEMELKGIAKSIWILVKPVLPKEDSETGRPVRFKTEDIMALVYQGFTDKEVSQKLGCSVSLVRQTRYKEDETKCQKGNNMSGDKMLQECQKGNNMFALEKENENDKENVYAAKNKTRPCACEIEQTEAVKASIEKIRVINALVEGQLRQNGITIPDGYENSVDLVLDALHKNGYAYDMVTITEEKFMTILTRIGQLFQKGERPTNLTSYVKAIVED